RQDRSTLLWAKIFEVWESVLGARQGFVTAASRGLRHAPFPQHLSILLSVLLVTCFASPERLCVTRLVLHPYTRDIRGPTVEHTI
ncbi:MAG: hypothetical protein ACKO96_46950, partial [Flammeovirgaceae bacterium]